MHRTNFITFAAMMLMAGIVAISSSCGDGPTEEQSQPPISVKKQEFSSVGVDRVIPLRFYKMYTGGISSTLYEAIMRSVHVANRVFDGAGVQFYVKAIHDCPSEVLHFKSTYADISSYHVKYNPDGNAYIDWATARHDLTCAFPGLPQVGPPGITTETEKWWMHYAVNLAGRNNEIPVWIHELTNDEGTSFAHSPDFNRDIHTLHFGLTGTTHVETGETMNDVLAHELGHTLGLYHTFEIAQDGYGTGRCWPGAQTTMDPETGENCRMSDFWDLVYGNGTPRFFTSFSAAKAAQDGGATLLEIDQKIDPDTTSCGRNSFGIRCEVEGTPYQYPPAPELRGIAFAAAPSYVAANAMSYIGGKPQGLSDSQARWVRKFLRFETELRSEPFSGEPARLTHLGRGAVQTPAQQLDFDNDGLRDLAWWIPPVHPEPWATFYVLESANGTFAGPVKYVWWGEAGDIPVPADYNGSGPTDVAIFRPGTLSGEDAYWYWCVSPNWTTHFCDDGRVAQFGKRGDVPFAGLDFDGMASTGQLTVYRTQPPGGSKWVWAFPDSPTVTQQKYLGNQNSVPLPGLYDSDEQTDLVVYYPEWATFGMLLSTQLWGSAIYREFPPVLIPENGTTWQRAGGVPVHGLVLHSWVSPYYRPRNVLAVMDPSYALWYVNWFPVTNPNPSPLCVVNGGGSVQMPLAGLGSTWQDRTSLPSPPRSHLAVFYNSHNSDGPSSIYYRTGPCGSSYIRHVYGYSRNAIAHVVRDMFGDTLPEVLVVDPDTMVVKVYSSDTNYQDSQAMQVSLGRYEAVLL